MIWFEKIVTQWLRIDAKYFLRGGFWLSVSQFFTILFGILSSALLAHFLSSIDYGVFRYLTSISILVAVFTISGLDAAIIQATAKKYLNFYSETFKINILYSLISASIGGIGFLYYLLKGNSLLAVGCLIIAFLTPTIRSFHFIPSLLQGTHNYRALALFQSLKSFFVSVSSISVVFLTKNILLLLIVYLISQALANFFGHLVFQPKKAEPTPRDVFNKYLSYAKHTSVRNLLTGVAFKIDSVIVFTQLGAAELALYSIAQLVPEQVKGALKNISSLLLVKYSANENFSVVKKAIWRRSLQLLLVLVACTLLYLLIAPKIYELLFPKYPDAIWLGGLLALSFPATLAMIPTSVLQAQLRERELHLLNIINSIFLVSATLIGVYFFHLVGAVTARVISRYFILGLSYFYYLRVSDAKHESS
ncbi:MAG: oligosaccharide flippase family protein [Patescibacteria group bacterium]